MTYSHSRFQPVTVQRFSTADADSSYHRSMGKADSSGSHNDVEFPSKEQLSRFTVEGDPTNSATGQSLFALNDDEFELISAYLDGEVSEQERAKVEQLIAEDPSVQQLYQEQLKLREAVKLLPLDFFSW